ncbi:hypothetical protein JOC85_002813 [Bacillus mesophilus]|uniref:hypothetical protein n=1 Tax=Bacillus mesophilus TaxID=1808955 RepID=UPI001969D2E7|nr:hypothetical protein [Bacillus mesophilus]MBM7662006.1 hypothetical protein [Bacillus mesophilus]
MGINILKSIPRILGILCYITTILFVASNFFPSYLLVYTYSVMGAILLMFSFFYISTVNRLVISILLTIGSIAFFISNVPIHIVIIGFGENMNLLSLFLLIPLIGTFMSSAGYLTILKKKVQEREANGAQHPYRLSYILTAMTGVLLNYGAIAIVKRISSESFSSYHDKKLTLNIMRAFGFCMLWSPYFVNIGLILVLFDLSWFDIGGYGFILSSIYLLLSWVLFRRISFSDDPIVQRKRVVEHIHNQQSLTPFFIFCAALIFLSFLLDFLLVANMLTVVSLLAVTLPFIWAIFTNVLKSFVQDVSEQVQLAFIRLKNELAVFISAGFFGMALSQTDIGLHISNVLFRASLGSIFLLSIFIVILTISLALVGIHPVIIVIGIGSALSPVKFGVSPEYMAMILLIAWTTATQMSPFSGQVLMTSRLMNVQPIAIIKQNILFAILLAWILTTATYIFLLLGWL